MFKKLLNVGKGHSIDKSQLQLQQQQQQKSLFQLNEIKSYGFSHFCCLGYSASLSLLAVGSKTGLLRVYGNSSVEFNYQLETGNAIRQIEFIDCRDNQLDKKKESGDRKDQGNQSSKNVPAKLIVLSENGQLHLFELTTLKRLNVVDNTTQTDNDALLGNHQNHDCLDSLSNNQLVHDYTKLEYVSRLDYLVYRPEDEDRSKRVTTLEISADLNVVFVGTEGGNLYQIPLDKFVPIKQVQEQQKSDAEQTVQRETGVQPILDDVKEDADEITIPNLKDEAQVDQEDVELFDMIKFDEDVASQISDDIKPKKQGAIESIKRHPSSSNKLLISYHRGLSIFYDLKNKKVENHFYHNQILESSCFAAGQTGDFFYTSHNDGSYIKWDTRKGSQSKADDDFLGSLYGPYPCKPTPKIQACNGMMNDQIEDLIIFSGGMPRATYDDKNPVTIVHTEPDGKDTIKMVLDVTSKVLDFAVITKPRSSLGAAPKQAGGGGKKGKNKNQQQQQQQRNLPVAVALAILAEEEFVVIDLLNSESFLEFPLPYLNCVQPSAITCNEHYSDISDELYEQLLNFSRQQSKGKLSQNEWPITGGKVIEGPEMRSHDLLLTGHEDGSVNMWDVSELTMRHLFQLRTTRFFTCEDDDLIPIDSASNNQGSNDSVHDGKALDESPKQDSSAWPPLKKVGKFDPYSDDTRLAVRKVSLCPQTGALLVAGTGGQVLVFELKNETGELNPLVIDEVTIVSDQRFTWKGREKLNARPGAHKFEPGYHLVSYVQLNPPVSATSTDLRSDWHLFAVGTSYGFVLYDYAKKHSIINKCTLNVQDFAIVSGDGGAMSRKKSFRKSLRESFRRLRRGRSQRNQQTTGAADQATSAKQPFGRSTAVARTLNSAPLTDTAQQAAAAHRNLMAGERQVEPKVELSSIVKCISLTSAVISSNPVGFRPSLWVGTSSGQVLVYTIELGNGFYSQSNQPEPPTNSEEMPEEQPIVASRRSVARLTKEIQLKHKAPIIAIFTTPEAPSDQSNSSDRSSKSTPERQESELFNTSQSDSGAEPGGLNGSAKSSPEKSTSERPQTPQPNDVSSGSNKTQSPSKTNKDAALLQQLQPRVLICSEEQFKVFNLPNMKPFCKFKLTAHEGLRAKKISITQFIKSSSSNSRARPQVASSQSTNSINSGPVQLIASKSSQSFATQTSPPASPVPQADSSSPGATGKDPMSSSSDFSKSNSDKSAAATSNGIQTQAKQQVESNNNLISTLNNNHASGRANRQQDKELLNAKFGAKHASTSTSSHNVATSGDKSSSNEIRSGDGDAISEPYMICMSNLGDCAVYSVPDLKRQAQIQVCKREDVNGITSAMLTNNGEGYYLKSSSNFLRFSISSHRVPRVLSVV